MTDTAKPLALITGVGPGTGAALARRFAEGNYRVAMLARNADRLSALEREISNSIAVPCDVSDAAALERAVAQVGDPKVVVHNAVGGALAPSSRSKRRTPAQLRDQHDGAVPPCSTHSTGDGGRRRRRHHRHR